MGSIFPSPSPKVHYINSDYFDYKTIDSFAHRYLKTYYNNIDPDEVEIARFLVQEYKKIETPCKMLDIGCGPTVHHLLPAVPYVLNIDVADYLDENLAQIKLWIDKHQHAHRWDHFTKKILAFEGIHTSAKNIQMRESELIQKIHTLRHCDVLQTEPVIENEKYPVVGFFYCAEEIATNKDVWRKVMKNVCNLVTPSGRLYLSALRATNFYTIIRKDGTHEKLPTAYILENDMFQILSELDFDMKNTIIKTIQTPSQEHQGINGVILVSAKKLEK
jgi:SAM-dependent methyltransferase